MPGPTVSPAGMRLIKLLVGNPPQSLEELIEAAGVTRTAVTEQLNDLVAAGFAQRKMERLPGRGRPRYLYSATDAALSELFPGNQGLLVPALWRALDSVGGTQLKRKVLRRVSNALAEHYTRQLKGKTPAERFREIAGMFRKAEGNLVEVEVNDEGNLTMRRRTCSFFSMAEETQVVCHIDEKMLAKIVGAPVHRTACRHDGSPCCVFELVDDE